MTTTTSPTTVLVLVGLPGAGKSSIARWLCESKPSVVHVEYDQVAESLNEKEELEGWRKSRVVALDAFSKHLEEPGGLIVMDDNFHLRSMRKTIYRICQDHVLKENNTIVLYGVVFVDTPLDVCLTRNSSRAIESRVRVEVIEKMAITLEPPDPTKATWDSSFIRVCGRHLDFQAITDWLVGELPNNRVPAPPQEVGSEELERERQATRESTLQKYDQLMRKWVGQVSRIDKRNSGNANKVRKILLMSLRTRDSISAEAVVCEFCKVVCMEWAEEKTKLLFEALLETVDGFS